MFVASDLVAETFRGLMASGGVVVTARGTLATMACATYPSALLVSCVPTKMSSRMTVMSRIACMADAGSPLIKITTLARI